MKRYIWKFIRLGRECFITALLIFLRPFASNLTLSYSSEFGKDGLGAQAQRILTVYGLAKFMHANYFHSSISFIPFHPLDGNNTVYLRSQYLLEVNDFLSSQQFCTQIEPQKFSREVIVNRLTLRVLIQEIMKSFVSDRTLMYIDEPFGVADFCYPVKYIISTFPIEKKKLKAFDSHKNGKHLVIHYRVTNGRFSDVTHDSATRQQELSHFKKVIERITDENRNRQIFITFLTDAPSKTLNVPIPSDELYVWQGIDSHKDGRFQISGIPDKAFLDLLPTSLRNCCEIIRGGSPLLALKIMISAHYLVMSRSSLSYTGALLNTSGKVFYPSGFWHPKKFSWAKY